MRPVYKNLAFVDLPRRRTEHSILQDEEMAKVMREQAHSAISLLSLHQKPLLRFSYSDVLANPMATAATINDFLGLQLDEDAMAQAVDPSLYREKQSS